MSKPKISIAFAWFYVAVYAAAIFIWSALPGTFILIETLQKFVSDKLLHLLEYLVLGILLARALGFSYHFQTLNRLIFVAFLLGSFYASTDEWHQSFVPNRVSSVSDWIADSLGILSGAYLRGSRMKKYIGRKVNA